MATDPQADTFDGDLLALVRQDPAADAVTLQRLMEDLGWHGFDAAYLRDALHRLPSPISIPASRGRQERQTEDGGTKLDTSPGLESIDLPTDRTWSELVPALALLDRRTQSKVHSPHLPSRWWMLAIKDLGPYEVQLACNCLARLLLEEHAHEPLRELILHLPSDASLEALPTVSTRAANAMLRNGVQTLSDLASVSPARILDWRGIGVGTVREVVAALIKTCLVAGAAPIQERQEQPGSAPEVVAREPVLDPKHAQVLADLQVVSRWLQLQGGPDDRSPWPTHVEERAPDEVQKAQDRLLRLLSRELAPNVPAGDAVALLEAALADLNAVQLEVVKRRVCADPPATLDSVGGFVGLTRERVRQIEADVVSRLSPLLDYGTATGDLLALVRAQIDPVTSLSRLLQTYPQLRREVPSAAAPLWLVLDRLDKAFEVQDGWAAAPSVTAARADTITVLEDLSNEYGVAPLRAVQDALPYLTEEELSLWLEYCQVAVMADHAVAGLQSIPDRAAALLSICGKPLTLEELALRAVPGRALNSIRNALGSDARFTRVDRTRWGLAEWGLESYTGIRDMVGREIDRAGGEIQLAALVDRLATTFAVSPASVNAYASAAPYELRGGVVRRRAGAATPRKSPYETAKLYRHADAWLYRITITHDHLRGSGFSVPVGVAKAVDCETGGVRELASRLGPQTVRWTGTQPGVASIRRFAEDLRLREGDVAFLAFEDTGQFEIRHPASPPAQAGPLAQALFLVGMDQAAPAPLPLLAAAVGLPRDAARATVLGAYRARNDWEIVQLLEKGWEDLVPEVQGRRQPADEAELLKLLGL